MTSLYTGEVLSWFGPAFQPVMLGVLSELMESMKTILSDFDLPCKTIWKDLTGNGVISQHNSGSKQTYLDRKKRTSMNIKVVVPNIYFNLGRTGRLVELDKLWVLPY